MQIIGISGKKGSGKDTFGQMLIADSALPSERIAFADSLKQEVATVCNVTKQFVETNKEVFRPMLQWWGTDFRRRYQGDDYWVVQLYQKIYEASKLGIKLVLVTDVRFKSEFDALKTLNAYMIRIARPSQVTDDKHISETDLDNCNTFDSIILNTGSLDDLNKETKTILKALEIPLK